MFLFRYESLPVFDAAEVFVCEDSAVWLEWGGCRPYLTWLDFKPYFELDGREAKLWFLFESAFWVEDLL